MDDLAPGDLESWLRENPQAALELARRLQPVGDWEHRTVSKPRHEEQLVRKNHLGHVVATVSASWGQEKFPDKAFCAWMTSYRAPHGLYRATVPECMVAADTELQENPKCLLVNPRSPASERRSSPRQTGSPPQSTSPELQSSAPSPPSDGP